MDSNLQVKKVLVTGAAGALGSVVASGFVEQGFDVTGVDLKFAQAPEGVKPIELDLTSSSAVTKFFDGLGSEMPQAIVHCAGGFRFTFLDTLSDKDIDFLVDLNFKSSFYLARECAKQFRKSKFGRLVFISAAATQDPGAGMGIYASSKLGINGLVKSMQAELKDLDVSVNAIMPTIIDTPTNRKDMPEADTNQWVQPSVIAKLCRKLVGPFGSDIRGALIPVVGRV